MAEILMPDIRTVMMMQMLVGFLFTAVFAIAWSQGEGGPAGLWAIGHGLVAAAIFLSGGIVLFLDRHPGRRRVSRWAAWRWGCWARCTRCGSP